MKPVIIHSIHRFFFTPTARFDPSPCNFNPVAELQRIIRPLVQPVLAVCAAAIMMAVQARAQNLENLPHYQPQRKVEGPIRCFGGREGGLMTDWEKAFNKYHPDVRFVNNLISSEGSIGGLYTGAYDLGPSGREAELMDLLPFIEGFGYPPTELVVASGSFDPGIKGGSWSPVIFVHKDNPITQLTLKQLDGIFGSERTGGWNGIKWMPQNGRSAKENIRTWGQLGLTGEWADKPIQTYGYAFTGMSKFFEAKVFKGGDKWNPNYRQYVESNGGEVADGEIGKTVTIARMLEELSNDKYGIGWTGLHYTKNTPKVKPIALAPYEGGEYVEPTRENMQNRTYPLTRSIFISLNRIPGQPVDPKFLEFLRFVLSREGQEVVAKHGRYLPLPTDTVREQLKKLE